MVTGNQTLRMSPFQSSQPSRHDTAPYKHHAQNIGHPYDVGKSISYHHVCRHRQNIVSVINYSTNTPKRQRDTRHFKTYLRKITTTEVPSSPNKKLARRTVSVGPSHPSYLTSFFLPVTTITTPIPANTITTPVMYIPYTPLPPVLGNLTPA